MLYDSMANQLRMMDRQEEAEELFLEALRIQRELAEENPETYEKELASICNDYGIFLKQGKRLEEAENLGREALEIRRSLTRSNPERHQTDLAESSEALGEILMRSPEKLAESKERYEEALELYEAHPGEEKQAQRIRGILEKYYGLERSSG